MALMNRACPCPYIPCPNHGDCFACSAKNRKEGGLNHCMEEAARRLGAVIKPRTPPTIVMEDSLGVAAECARRVAALLEKKPDALLCFPAGESAKETFSQLVALSKAGEVSFDRARFVQLDEWLDLEDESENCSAFMNANFYGPAGIREKQIRSFDIHARDLDAQCEAMDDYLEKEGPIDLMLLGLGMNGHVGLNEPHVPWDRGAVLVELADTTKEVGQKYFTGGMNLKRGITLGMRHVFAAKAVILQVAGEKKAGIVKTMFETPPVITMPGTVMQLHSGGLIVLDEAAARLIDRDLLAACIAAAKAK